MRTAWERRRLSGLGGACCAWVIRMARRKGRANFMTVDLKGENEISGMSLQ
jgi:hypothetical protein